MQAVSCLRSVQEGKTKWVLKIQKGILTAQEKEGCSGREDSMTPLSATAPTG